MALLHRATLAPSKLDLLTNYLNRGELRQLGAYRFDDPTNQVGIECHLVADGTGSVLHLPLTYRSESLPSADEWLVGVMEHSVLGTRWAYNACADATYAAELIRVILTGGSQVEEYFETDSGREFRAPTAEVLGSGSPDTDVPAIGGVHAESFESDTIIDAGGIQVVVRHGLDAPTPDSTEGTLSGTWAGSDQPVVLAYLP